MKPEKKKPPLFWTLAALFSIMWIAGVLSSYTMGGAIHILIILAVAAVIAELRNGRNLVP